MRWRWCDWSSITAIANLIVGRRPAGEGPTSGKIDTSTRKHADTVNVLLVTEG